jgi:formate--tetrahydrofolate ligase
MENLAAHAHIVRSFGLPCVFGVNRHRGDSEAEVALVLEGARELGADDVALNEGFLRGGEGAEDLARAVLGVLERPGSFAPVNPPGTPIREQVQRIATGLYGADGVEFSPQAVASLARLDALGLGELPVCMAKTNLSLSHDKNLKGRPRGWTLPVRDLVASVGAGFVVVLCGDVMLMPGLGREPAFTKVDIDGEGRTTGLF